MPTDRCPLRWLQLNDLEIFSQRLILVPQERQPHARTTSMLLFQRWGRGTAALVVCCLLLIFIILLFILVKHLGLQSMYEWCYTNTLGFDLFNRVRAFTCVSSRLVLPPFLIYWFASSGGAVLRRYATTCQKFAHVLLI